MSNILYGRNPVTEALKSGREIEKILMQKGGEGSVKKIEAIARDRKIPIQYVDKAALDRVAGDSGKINHQGVAAYISAYDYFEVDDILERAAQREEEAFVIILDGIEDPHNLGAIIRTADGAGAHGIIIPKRRAAGLTETVAKASAGAIEYVPVARVSNLTQTIEYLKGKVFLDNCVEIALFGTTTTAFKVFGISFLIYLTSFSCTQATLNPPITAGVILSG